MEAVVVSPVVIQTTFLTETRGQFKYNATVRFGAKSILNAFTFKVQKPRLTFRLDTAG